MEIPGIYQTIIGIVAGALTAASMLPQLIKLIKDKKAEDISVIMLLVLMLGLGLWIFYGVVKKDPPIIITNSVSLAISLSVTILSLVYKKKT